MFFFSHLTSRNHGLNNMRSMWRYVAILAVIPISNNNIIHAKLIAALWECSNVLRKIGQSQELLLLLPIEITAKATK